MPLSDVEIWAEIGAGYLKIDPIPSPDRVVASSIDLLLHTEILVLPNPEDVRGISVDPALVQVTQLLESRGHKEDLSSKPYELIPGEFVIAKTYEEIELPAHLAARVEGRSSLGRLGIPSRFLYKGRFLGQT